MITKPGKENVYQRMVRIALSGWIATVLLATSAWFSAQESGAQAQTGVSQTQPAATVTNKFARPNLASEGQTTVRESGTSVKFFRTGSNHGSGRQYIVYEPPIFLLERQKADGSLELDASVAADGTVTVRFVWDTSPRRTQEAIRKYIQSAWPPEQRSGLEDAIIEPMFFEVGWIESALVKTMRSQEFPGQSFSTTGEIKAYFQTGSRSEGERFLAALNEADPDLAPVQLNFRYSFVGDALESCEATATSEQIETLSREKEIAGRGAERLVERDQLLRVAEKALRRMNIKSTCRDPEKAERLALEAVSRLGEPKRLDTWDELEAFSGLSPADFVSNLTREKDWKDRIVERKQLRQAATKAVSDQKSGKVSAGWGGFMGAVGASLAEASQDARSLLTDELRKQSIEARWQGEEVVPKTIDVHTRESIDRVLSGTITIQYNVPIARKQVHVITLTELNRAEVNPERSPRERRNLVYALEELESAVGRLDQAIATTAEHLADTLESRVARAAERLNRRMRRLDARVDEELALHAHTLDALTRAMKTVLYEFVLDGRGAETNEKWRDFPTGVSSDEYPVAFVNSWGVNPKCLPSEGLPNPQLVVNSTSRYPEREWLIVVRDGQPSCDRLDVMVTFTRTELVESATPLERGGRTGGAPLERVN